MIRAYITIIMNMTLMGRAMKVTVTLVLKKTAINTLQAVITSATRCKAYHEPVCLVEDRKVAVRLTFLLKIEFLNQKCKLTNNNPTMQMIEKVDLSMT